MNTRRAATFMTMAVSLTAALVIASLVAFTFRNDSGQCAFSPYIALTVFIPVLVTGLVQIIFQRRDHSAVFWGASALFMGLAGIVLLVYLDRSETLVHYDEQIVRGPLVLEPPSLDTR